MVDASIVGSAGIFGGGLTLVAIVLLVLGALASEPPDVDETTPTAIPETADCETIQAEIGVAVSRSLDDARPCVVLEYEIVAPGVGFVSLGRTAGGVGIAFEAFGPNGRSLGNDTVAPDSESSAPAIGLPRAGQHVLVMSRNGEGEAELRVTLNVQPARVLSLGSGQSGNLTGADADGYLISDVSKGAGLELTADAPVEAELDLALTDPGGFLGAAGTPPISYNVLADGQHFLLVSSRVNWSGRYRVELGQPTTTGATTTTTLPAADGLPRSFYATDGFEARDALLAAGFMPRSIDVCSSSVGAGLVRQIVDERIDDEGIVEVILDDSEGITTEGRAIQTGFEVVLKISTGNPCGTQNWLVIVGTDKSLEGAAFEVERGTAGTEFEGRASVFLQAAGFQTAISGFPNEADATAQLDVLKELFPFADVPFVIELTTYCPSPTEREGYTECAT